MEDQRLIIKRKTLEEWMSGGLRKYAYFTAIFVLMSGFSLFVFGLDLGSTVLTYICVTVFIAFVSIIKYWGKTASDSPAFEITGHDLIIYDNPQYSRIPLADISDCEIFVVREGTRMGIFLKPGSSVKGNITKGHRFAFNIPQDGPDAVVLEVGTEEISPSELKDIIKDRIE